MRSVGWAVYIVSRCEDSSLAFKGCPVRAISMSVNTLFLASE